ncbi:hypothetical protein [Ktedonobacter racemifer]|uniref:3-keto-disaccharide hydrolase domain-containing protein n=1 Tax=Ktedonobacter racemifer DSM 44963 TaxID=485913 RepID=D6TI94_KTERA|nr:hypothetical protein [Ktedonobacter racemifer]EFH89151.1 hypothetical protein Krac_10689 [Ktedonobacter racemifer DSM 44963]
MQFRAWYRQISAIGIVTLLAIWLAGCGALVTSAPPPQATASTAVIKPYPTPSSTQSLYSSALTAQAAGWASGPECAFTSHGLAIRPNGGQAYICFAPTSPPTDLSVTVTVQQTSGTPTHAFGIAIRHTAPKTYAFFGIDGRGHFAFTTVVNDVSHTVIPFTPNAAIHAGAKATNRLQVIASGQTITLLVNGTPVGQATLSTAASGTVGLRGINDGEVVFQHLSIAQV